MLLDTNFLNRLGISVALYTCSYMNAHRAVTKPCPGRMTMDTFPFSGNAEVGTFLSSFRHFSP